MKKLVVLLPVLWIMAVGGWPIPATAQMMDIPAAPPPHADPGDQLTPERRATIDKLADKVAQTAQCLAIWTSISRAQGIAGVTILAQHNAQSEGFGKQLLHDSQVSLAKVNDSIESIMAALMTDIHNAKLPFRQGQLQDMMVALARHKNQELVDALSVFSDDLTVAAISSRSLRAQSLVCDAFIETMIGHSPDQITSAIPDLDYSKF